MTATYENSIEASKLLIKAGADINAQDDLSDNPFHYAASMGYLEITNACIATGNVDYTVFDRYGGTALIAACERAHTEVIAEILKIEGYPIDHVNNLGWTALMEAIVLGNGGKSHTQTVE